MTRHARPQILAGSRYRQIKVHGDGTFEACQMLVDILAKLLQTRNLSTHHDVGREIHRQVMNTRKYSSCVKASSSNNQVWCIEIKSNRCIERDSSQEKLIDEAWQLL